MITERRVLISGMYEAIFSNQDGEWMENPGLAMLGRSGNNWVVPERTEMIPLPKGSSLLTIPGYYPVGLDGDNEAVCMTHDPYHPQKKAGVVAALLPQGFTRTLLPACVPEAPSKEIPLFGYTAVGFHSGQIYAAAVQSDGHQRWHPRHYNTARLDRRIYSMLRKYPENRIMRQLACCSLQYGCFTAQNLFYRRWEAGIPTTPVCNANCLGCISEKHGEADSPQNRIDFIPTVKEIFEIGVEHLQTARDAIISFGQGCEGEPSLNAALIAGAIRSMRASTEKGLINMNTHGGNYRQLKQLFKAGLDAIRVTIFSLREEDYNLYHRPQNYRLGQVKDTIKSALDHTVRVSINLLVFPGFTDQADQIEALLTFVGENPVNMIQLRNLNIDPEVINHHLGFKSSGLGITTLIGILQQEAPQVNLGSYTHSMERPSKENRRKEGKYG